MPKRLGPHLLGAKPRPQDDRDYVADPHVRMLTPASRRWVNKEPVLDQGATPHCIGFGGAQYSNTLPVDMHDRNSDGHALYYQCKLLDGEPGQENGSDVRTLARALLINKRIREYAFAQTVNDAKAWVLNKGPVIVGSVWTEKMFYPSKGGFVSPKGEIAGGHCYLITGYSNSQGFRCLNSWGDQWGIGGYFRITAGNLARLADIDWLDLLCASELPA